MALEGKESQSKAKTALAAAAGVLVGFGLGYTLRAYRNEDKASVAIDEDHRLQQKIMSLRNQLINAEKIMDGMILDLTRHVDIDVRNFRESCNAGVSINPSKQEYLTYLLNRLKKKLTKTLAGFENIPRKNLGLKSQLLECQKKFQRLESLPIGHTEFSWNGGKNCQKSLVSTEEFTPAEQETKKTIALPKPAKVKGKKVLSDNKLLNKQSNARRKRFSMMGNVFNTAVRLKLAKDLKAVFKRLDKTGKEYISRDDLKVGINKMQLEHIIHNDSELEQLWVAMDLDKDNRISYADFEAFCKLHDPKAKEYTKRKQQTGSARS